MTFTFPDSLHWGVIFMARALAIQYGDCDSLVQFWADAMHWYNRLNKVSIGAWGKVVQGVRCKVQGARCKVQGARCKVQGARCKVQGARWCQVLCGEGWCKV